MIMIDICGTSMPVRHTASGIQCISPEMQLSNSVLPLSHFDAPALTLSPSGALCSYFFSPPPLPSSALTLSPLIPADLPFVPLTPSALT